MGRIQRYPIFYSNRFETLAEFLGQRLFDVSCGIFQKRIVIVPSEPVKRFLSFFFASHPHYRIAAGVEWKTLPEGLLELFSFEDPSHRIPSFFELTLRIEEVICGAVGRSIDLTAEEAAQLSPLVEYAEASALSMAGLSAQLAQVFFQYGLYGADFLPQWLESSGWQQWVWKRIYNGHWQYPVSLAPRNEASIPCQLHLFGFHFLPRVYQDFFCRLGAVFYQLSPCAMFWEDAVAAKDRIGLRRYFEKREVRASELEQWEGYVRDTHPLLANWGKLSRTFIQQLGEGEENYCAPTAEGILSRVQLDFLHLRSPDIAAENSVSSIEIHSAPSAFREVEVLYDLLLKRMQSDPTLTPRDILVLSPQLNRYTPFIEAIFGAEGSAFSYSVEQIFFPSQNEVVSGLFQLLEIAKEGLLAEAVLKLFASPAFLKQWGFSSQDVRKIRLWVKAAGGENASERWLMSLVLRAPTGEPIPDFLKERWPCGGLEISDIDLLNQWFVLTHSLKEDLKPILQKELCSLREWFSRIGTWVERYFGESEDRIAFCAQMKRWNLEGFEHYKVFSSACLERWLQAWAQDLGHKGVLGQLQRVTFLPLRSSNPLPARVICLLGMDESAFPKRENPFVLSEMKLQKEWIPTRLEEDRSCFLEVLTLVREQLIISYERLDLSHAPSSLVQELCLTYPDIAQVDHPSLPFLEKDLPTERFYRCAQRAQAPPVKVKPFYTAIERRQGLTIPLKDLALLAKHPIQFYFQKGYQIFMAQEEDANRDIVLSFRQQALLRNRAFRSSKEGLPLWKLQSRLPKGIFGEVAAQALQEELKKRENCEESTTLEFSPLCDAPQQVRKGYWICPAPRFLQADGTEMVVTGALEGVTSKGLLFHGEDRWEERMKYWPQWLMLAQRQGIPSEFPALLLSTQSQGPQNRWDDREAPWGDYLQRYLNYYREALCSPSLLMPSWIPSLLKGSFEEFEKQRTLSLRGHLFTDKWLAWVERMRAWPPLKESFDHWSDYTKTLYPEILCPL